MRLAVELLAVGADEAAHPLLLAFLAAVEHHPHVEVRGRVGVELGRERDRRGDARGVVVRPGDDLGELDLDQHEDGDEQDERGEELEDRDRVGVEPGHSRAEQRQQHRQRPEDDSKEAEGHGRALRETGGAAGAARRVDRAAAGGVDVGADHEPRAGAGVRTGGDDVLRAAAEEERAQQVEAVVEVEVHRRGGEEHEREPDDGRGDRDEAAGEADQAVPGVHERRLRMHVGRLDLGSAPERAQALGEPVGGPALGVGAGEPALERAQLPNDLHAPCRIHGRGII